MKTPTHPLFFWCLIVLTVSLGLPLANSHAQSVNPTGQTITFWHPHTGERETALNQLVAQFNAENEWKITVEPRSLQNPGLLYDQITLQLTTPPENRALPNVFVAAPYETALFALGSPVLDLTPFIQDEGWGLGDVVDFVPGIAELGHDPFTNTQLGWPERLFAEALYVNMTALRKMGHESPPANLDELSEMACEFFAQTNTPAFQLEVRAPVWAGLAAANGNPIFDPALPAYTLKAERMRESLEMMIELLTEGCIIRQTTSFGAQDEFIAGRAIFYFGSTSALPIIKDAINQNSFEWQIVPLSNKPYISAPTISIFSHSPEADLATWLFLRWWLSPEINAAWNRATGSLPIRLSAGDLMVGDFFPQWQQVWAMVKQGGYFEPSVAAQDVVRLEIEFAIGRILEDPASLESELSALSHLANEILSETAPTTPITKQASP